MKTKIFANYGVLSHEKEIAYTIAPHESATVSDPIEIEIPESVSPCTNEVGEIIVQIDGTTYLLSEVLTNAGDKPVLRWFDGNGYKSMKLMAE